MELRIIAGTLKGRKIRFNDAQVESLRPTKNIVRQAVANIVQAHIQRARVADVCAGSGAFGFEMLSRGAQSVVFIEIDQSRVAGIVKQALEFGVGSQCKVHAGDITNIVQKLQQEFDIIYFDPPYTFVDCQDIVARLLGLLAPHGVLIYERQWLNQKESHATPVTTELVSEKRKFGKTLIELFYTE